MLRFAKPVRKLSNYVSKVTVDGVKPLTVTLRDVRVLNVHSVENGHLMRIWVHDKSDEYKTICDADDQCLEHALTNNNAWFNNDLDASVIQHYFKPSLNTSYHTMLVCAENMPGRSAAIVANGQAHNSISEVVFAKDASVDITMDVSGLFFYATKFGIRWNVRKVIVTDADAEPIEPDKCAVDQQWEHDVDEFDAKVSKDIDQRREYVANARQLLAEIRQMPEPNEEWNSKCEGLSKLISGYRILSM